MQNLEAFTSKLSLADSCSATWAQERSAVSILTTGPDAYEYDVILQIAIVVLERIEDFFENDGSRLDHRPTNAHRAAAFYRKCA